MTLDLFLVIITNVISIVLPFSPLPHSHSIFLSLFLSLPLHFHSIFLLSLLLLLLRTNGCCPYFEQIRFLTEVPCSVIVLICISLFSKRKRRRKKEKKILRKKNLPADIVLPFCEEKTLGIRMCHPTRWHAHTSTRFMSQSV